MRSLTCNTSLPWILCRPVPFSEEEPAFSAGEKCFCGPKNSVFLQSVSSWQVDEPNPPRESQQQQQHCMIRQDQVTGDGTDMDTDKTQGSYHKTESKGGRRWVDEPRRLSPGADASVNQPVVFGCFDL